MSESVCYLEGKGTRKLTPQHLYLGKQVCVSEKEGDADLAETTDNPARNCFTFYLTALQNIFKTKNNLEQSGLI